MIRILDAEKVPLSEILARTEDTRDLSGTVAGIIAEVRKHGDEALRRYSREFDKADVHELEVPPARMEQALAALDPALRAVLEEAAENIRASTGGRSRTGLSSARSPAWCWGRR